MTDQHCPCGSGQRLRECCARIMEDPARAASAEQLMRSRYTAWTLGRLDHVSGTWHPDTRPPALAADPERRWLGLRIVGSRAGQPGDLEGQVEFVARSKVGGRAQRMHEASRFVFEQGRWWYVDGDVHSR